MTHVIFAFTFTFQLNFALMVVISGFILHKNCCEHTGRSFIPFIMVRRKSDTFNTVEVANLYSLCWHYVFVLCAAMACWLTDQFGCEVRLDKSRSEDLNGIVSDTTNTISFLTRFARRSCCTICPLGCRTRSCTHGGTYYAALIVTSACSLASVLERRS